MSEKLWKTKQPGFEDLQFFGETERSWAETSTLLEVPRMPLLQEGAERFVEIVKEASDGRLNIKMFAGGELIPPLGVFDAVSQGTVQMGISSPVYWAGKCPAAQVIGGKTRYPPVAIQIQCVKRGQAPSPGICAGEYAFEKRWKTPVR